MKNAVLLIWHLKHWIFFRSETINLFRNGLPAFRSNAALTLHNRGFTQHNHFNRGYASNCSPTNKHSKYKATGLIFFILFSFTNLYAFQTQNNWLTKAPVKQYTKADDLHGYQQLLSEFGNNKILPEGFEIQALVALSHFPELKNEFIAFRFKAAKVAHTSSPSLCSVFRKQSKRKYIITIANKTKEGLDSTRLANLPYNAQIGVLGHELAHVVDYQTLNFIGLLKFGLLYIKEKDIVATENKTDEITIDHGLGYQLLAWSKQVHNLHIKDGRGERYLSPQQILGLIEKHFLYGNEFDKSN